MGGFQQSLVENSALHTLTRPAILKQKLFLMAIHSSLKKSTKEFFCLVGNSNISLFGNLSTSFCVNKFSNVKYGNL